MEADHPAAVLLQHGMDAGNFSNSTLEHHRPGSVVTTLVTLVFLPMLLTTVTGNILVCLAVFLVRKLHRPENYLLVSLAVVDGAVGVFVMPFAYAHLVLGRWTFGRTVCNLWTSVDVTLCTASILNLCAISVDRYWAITKPLTYATCQRSTRRILSYIAGVWVLALLISVVPLLAFEHPGGSGGKCQVSQNVFYQLYATLGSFYAPTIIMVIVNVKIVRAARRLAKSERSHNSVTYNVHAITLEESPTPSIQLPLINRVRRALEFGSFVEGGHSESFFRGEGKALKTLGIIMGAFITCWLPFFTIALLKPLFKAEVPSWLDYTALWLGYFNSTLNPLIYAKYNRDFRVPFREMLCCRFSTLQSVLRSAQFREKFGAPSPSALHTGSPVSALVHENRTVTLSNHHLTPNPVEIS